MSAHARFAPSAAHRWLNCTGSVDAAACYADPPSEAAQEGTAGHWLLERCLVEGWNAVDALGRTIVVSEDGIERSFVVSRDMVTDVQLGVDYIRQVVKTPGVSAVEYRVDLSFLEVDQFGTSDLWHHGVNGVLTIADFKYGRIDVDPIANVQMMIYLAGILRAIDEKRVETHKAPITIIKIVIIQPRSVAPVPRIKEWTTTPAAVLHLASHAADAMLRANRAPAFQMGDWCKYCPALGACPVTQEETKQLVPILTATELTPADAVRILSRKNLLESIVKRAEKVALEAMMNGIRLPGYKLVTSVKHRQWRDENLARQRLLDAAGGAALTIVTPAQAEKLGADAKSVVNELAFTPAGEPTVAAESDKRTPYTRRTAAQIFGP
jgi:hypothetical protein